MSRFEDVELVPKDREKALFRYKQDASQLFRNHFNLISVFMMKTSFNKTCFFFILGVKLLCYCLSLITHYSILELMVISI